VNTPKPVWNPDIADPHDYGGDWSAVPDNAPVENGFKLQWEQFIRHIVEDAPHPFDFLSGARGVRLAAAALQSARTGQRVALDELAVSPLAALAGAR
jgi:predicted dehydrogenase